MINSSDEEICGRLEDKNFLEYVTYEILEVLTNYNLEDNTYCIHQRIVDNDKMEQIVYQLLFCMLFVIMNV